MLNNCVIPWQPYNEAKMTKGNAVKAATSILFTGIALLAGSAWAGAPLLSKSDSKPVWLTDFAAAQEQARRDNRPIFVVLHCRH
jgi:hypothetical protein